VRACVRVYTYCVKVGVYCSLRGIMINRIITKYGILSNAPVVRSLYRSEYLSHRIL
jgi:hypothetical protein